MKVSPNDIEAPPPAGFQQDLQQDDRPYRLPTSFAVVDSRGLGGMDVYMSLNVVSLFSVNTVEETFSARINVSLVWAAGGRRKIVGDENEAIHLAHGLDCTDADWEPNWFPQWGIRDKVESTEVVETFQTVMVGREAPSTDEEWDLAFKEGTVTRDHFWIIRETTMNIVVNTGHDLHFFPFDIQELTISVRLNYPSSKVRLRAVTELPPETRTWLDSQTNDSEVAQRSFQINFDNVGTAEFRNWERYPCKIRLTNTFENRVRRFHCGAMEVGIFVERHMGYYIWNVFLMVCCICSLNWAVWCIKMDETSDRIAADFALLLTGQAFKLVIADKLPKVNYLTAIDLYIIGGFIFVCTAIVMHASTCWQGSECSKDTDETLLRAWGYSWLIYNILWVIAVFVLRCVAKKRLISFVQGAGFQLPRREDVMHNLTSVVAGLANSLIKLD